jgi:hypothetical protein
MTSRKPSHNNHPIRHPISRSVAALTAIAVLAGCATASKDVSTTYLSPVTYQHYDCEQIGAEIARVQQRAGQLAGRLDEAASNDKTIAGVGLILFWPALFALGGTKQQEAEYARLKGESDALSQAAINRKCPGAVAAPSAPA